MFDITSYVIGLENGGGGVTSVTDAEINAAGHLIITLSDGTTLDAGYAVGPQGEAGIDGADGANGSTFTPVVSSAGVITWTNDGNLPNPASVDLVAAVLTALPDGDGVSY